MTRRIIHQGRKFTVAQDTEADEGGRTLVRDVILHPGASAILPFLDSRTIVLLRNRRPVLGETLWEIPAGTLEPGEDPELAARRELAEETGYQAATWQKMIAFYPSPGVMNEMIHLYTAQELTPGPMHLEADETIEPKAIPLHQAYQWIWDGTIQDAKTIVALLIWQSTGKAS